MDKQKLQQEDTVSADRKTKIVFDPDAWKKSDRSGKRIVSVANRQNFNNMKFTRKKNKGFADADIVDDDIKEGTTQPTGSSDIDVGTSESPTSKTPADQGSETPKKKKGSSQIEFVTGTPTADGASTTTGDQHRTNTKGKIGEGVVVKALRQIKTNKNTGVEDMGEIKKESNSDIPFDPPYEKHKDRTNSDGSKTSGHSMAKQLVQQSIADIIKKNKEKKDGIKETTLNPNDPHGDYKAKRKAINDIQMDPNTNKDKELMGTLKQRKADLEKEYDSVKEETKGEADRQINFYKFLQRLKRAGVAIPASIKAEETNMSKEELKTETVNYKSFLQFVNEKNDDDEEDMDAGNASKAVKETPKSERDPEIEKYKPAKYDADAAAKRRRIDAHQEKMRNKEDDLGW